MRKSVTNVAASVRARLLNLTKERGGDFNLTLQRYAAERFLYCLGASPHRPRFVLKGAMLFVLWDEAFARPTRDLDLAGNWENDGETLVGAVREMCAAPRPDDGLEFRLDTLEIEPVRDADEYHGFRLHLDVGLAGAVVPFQVDVGFGDAVVPEPVDVTYPVLLDADPPQIRAYPREASISEKLHAMVVHGTANTRFKDFFDIFILSERFAFEGPTLAASISATFSGRKSAAFSPWPVALTTAFYADAARADQWNRYLRRIKLTTAPQDFAPVGARVIAFLEAPARAVPNQDSFSCSWPPGGPWR